MKFRWSLLFLICVIAIQVQATQSDVVHHPAPKEPQYIHSDWYESLKKKLPPPPAQNSDRQKQDEADLLSFQKKRTPQECERARREIFVSLGNFFGPPGALIDEASVKRLSPFFDGVRNDADYFIQKLKKDFPRQRPFLYIKGAEPCVSKEVTLAYPSGHSTLANLFAMILSDFYPSKQKELTSRARQIAEDRVLSGMHHTSDIDAGRELAQLIYFELKKSKKFVADFSQLKEQVK